MASIPDLLPGLHFREKTLYPIEARRFLSETESKIKKLVKWFESIDAQTRTLNFADLQIKTLTSTESEIKNLRPKLLFFKYAQDVNTQLFKFAKNYTGKQNARLQLLSRDFDTAITSESVDEVYKKITTIMSELENIFTIDLENK